MEIRQHMRHHHRLVAGVAHTNPYAAEILADMCHHRAGAIVARMPATTLHAQAAGRQIDLIMEHRHIFRLQLVEGQRL